MAKLSVQAKSTQKIGLRHVGIVTIAVVLLYKSQRATCTENVESISTDPSETSSFTTSEPLTCPDFCNLPPDSATRSKAPFPRWYFDASEGTCKRFRWGGRGGNPNRFFKRQDCEEACANCNSDTVVGFGRSTEETSLKDKICNLSVDEGNCNDESDTQSLKTPQVAWYFDQDQGQCFPFIFYGCGGNTNRFLTRADCEEVCF